MITSDNANVVIKDFISETFVSGNKDKLIIDSDTGDVFRLTDFERNIYYTVRCYFDCAILLLEEILGLRINKKYAEEILREYLSAEGYMYYGATCYNIPWMLLYFGIAKPVYGKLVREGSSLYDMLKDCDEVLLVRCKDSRYYRVDKTGGWLDFQYSFILHDRKIRGNEVKEEIRFCLSSSDENNLPIRVAETVLDINEYRFPNWMHSKRAASHRDDELLRIAGRLMPDLP